MPDAATAAKSLQSCPTLWDPIDGSPPGSPVPGILQARTLEWVSISFSNAWKWKVKSCPTLSNPMDCSPPGSSVHGILQASILEWVTMPFSWESSRPRDQTWVSCIAGRFFTICTTREAPWLVHGKCYLSVLVFSWLEDRVRKELLGKPPPKSSPKKLDPSPATFRGFWITEHVHRPHVFRQSGFQSTPFQICSSSQFESDGRVMDMKSPCWKENLPPYFKVFFSSILVWNQGKNIG